MNKQNFFTILTSFFFCTAIVFSFEASAQETSDEFNEGMSEASEIADWDTDGDGELDAHEFYVVNYRIWDTDNDSRISQEEWEAGMENYIVVDRQSEMAMFPDWDVNQDDSLDVNEFTLVMVESDPFDFGTSAPMKNEQDMQDQTTQSQNMEQSDSQMEDPTVMIWQLDNDDLVEKITYGDWQIKLDEDDN
jgi:hypothetical protein